MPGLARPIVRDLRTTFFTIGRLSLARSFSRRPFHKASNHFNLRRRCKRRATMRTYVILACLAQVALSAHYSEFIKKYEELRAAASRSARSYPVMLGYNGQPMKPGSESFPLQQRQFGNYEPFFFSFLHFFRGYLSGSTICN